MKKILFATTALVATAGVAMADVDIKGNAEIGIVGGDAYGDVTQLHTDVDVDINMSGEADNGLTFSVALDLDEANDDRCTVADSDAAANANDLSGELSVACTDDATGDDSRGGGVTFGLAYGGFGLEAGDADGALDWAMKEVLFGSGSINDAEEHAGYNGNSGLKNVYGDGQTVRFTYTFGDFAVALGTQIDDAGVGNAMYGIGAKGSFDFGGTTLNVGVGYEEADTNGSAAGGKQDTWGISVDGALASGFTAGLNYSEMNMSGWANVQTHIGVGVGYAANQLSVGLNYGKFDNVGGVGTSETDGFGLTVGYDLGGGLEAQFGYGQSTMKTATGSTDTDSFSLGLAMSF